MVRNGWVGMIKLPTFWGESNLMQRFGSGVSIGGVGPLDSHDDMSGLGLQV